ncbi:hypothetical protein [Janthinobacterium sp.]|uniref:hypothetical protein n=1 Tax=Janthinobacterium sp. TaxID=1871054 RepID=UPI00293D3DB2|nr:hypothetical protein [Janthinobacterium sp.]
MSQRNNKRRAGGFTLFESAVAAIVVAVLGGVLLTRLLYYREQAELAAVERTAALLRVALTLRQGELYSSGKEAAVPGLAGQNPMEWLAEKPVNYAGEFYAPARGEIAGGQWYFDRTTRKLVYLLSGGKSLLGTTPMTLSFQLRPSAAPAPGNSLQFATRGIVLDQVRE